MAVEQHITYKRELHAGDIVTIRSTVLEIKDKVLQIFHEMTNDETGEVAATMRAVAIHIDMNARKARSIPEDIRSRAVGMIGEDVQSALPQNSELYLDRVSTGSGSDLVGDQHATFSNDF